MNFLNKTAVIIGGTSGIGLSVAHKIIASGGNVIIGGRSEEKITQALYKLGERSLGFIIDNSDKESIKRFFDQLQPFDYLFTPGATYTVGSMHDLTDEETESPFKSKFWGQYYAVKEASKKISKHGSIVLMSGAASVRPLKNSAAYAACNAAIEGLGKALALDLSPVRVNTISPGTTDSDLWQNRPKELRESAYAMWKTISVTQKVITVDEVSDAVCFLMLNNGMTGSTIYVDGGYTLK